MLLASSDGLLDQPPGNLPIVDDARWSAALTSHSLVALLAWIVMLVVLQAATWPFARLVFAKFPDRGWGFARLLTALIAAWPIWFLASLEVLSFRAIWCGLAVAIVAVLAWLLCWRPPATRSPTVPWYRNPYIIGTEIVFWGFFAWFLAYRFVNPDSWHIAWGGEKPMEFAHINAILRSAHFPPVDPWYAGGTLNYYYYGMYLVAFLIKLTGIPSEIAFNLAQPTMIAFLAAGAWSVGTAIAHAISRQRALVLAGGVLSVILVNVAGNLVVAARLVSGLGETMPTFGDYVYWFWDPRQIVPRTINEFPYFTATYADLHAHVVALPITVLIVATCLAIALDARELALTVARPLRSVRRTFVTLIRPALLVILLTSLYMTNAWDVPTYGAVVAASLVLATRAIGSWWQRIGIAASITAAIAVIAYLAALPFTRNFLTRYGEVKTVRDFSPLVTVEAHFGVFILIAIAGIATVASRRWQRGGGFLNPLVFWSILLALLLWRWSAVGDDVDFTNLIDAVTAFFVVGWLLAAVGLAMTSRLDFGIPAIVGQITALVAWLAVVWALTTERTAMALLLGIGLAAALAWFVRDRTGIRFALMLIAAGMLVAAGVEVVYLVDDLGGGVWYRMNTVFKFYNAAWILLALGCAALLVTMLRELLAGHMAPNTSPGNLSVASGQSSVTTEDSPAYASVPAGEGLPSPPNVAPVQMATTTETVDASLMSPESSSDDEIRPLAIAVDEASPLSREPAPRWSLRWSQFGLIVATLAILASFAYPVFATGVRLNQHFPQDGRHWTLNALDWMDYGEIDVGGVTLTYAGDRAAIEWFNEHVAGTPVIAEAVLGAYYCAGSRISIHTGLPAVVGWTWHETQQRGPTDLYQREMDVRDLYTSGDPAVIEGVIKRYGIEYIVVGDLERWYPEPNCAVSDNRDGIAAIDGLVGSRLEVAFQSGNTVVFRVTGN